MILVTTAGKVGAETARLLARRPEPVRALVREPNKGAALAGDGVQVVRGDLDLVRDVDEAVEGVSAVVLVSPGIPAQELRVIDRAVRAGVKHVVAVTSKAAADSPIGRQRGHAQIEEGLVSSGLGYTLLRSNAYMQNFLMAAPAIAATSSFGSSSGEGRIGMIDTRDLAAVAAEIAVNYGAHGGSTYWLTGPESLSYADAAQVLSRVLGRTVTYRRLTPEEQMTEMVEAGVPPAVAEDNTRWLTTIAAGEADYVTTDVADLLGRPAVSFEQFVSDHASAFA